MARYLLQAWTLPQHILGCPERCGALLPLYACLLPGVLTREGAKRSIVCGEVYLDDRPLKRHRCTGLPAQ